MATFNQNHSMFAGESKTFTVGPVTNEVTGAVVDLTGATITWVLKRGSTAVLTKTVGSGITVASPTTGVFTITLTAANTSSLSGSYQQECRTTLADSTVATLFTGEIQIQPDLTA